MKAVAIIEELRRKLSVPVGRHLYGVLGTYRKLADFAAVLREAKTADGIPFTAPHSVNRGILQAIPDDEFREVAENEAGYPEVAAKHVKNAFDRFLRRTLTGKGPVVLAELELLFAYQVEFETLRTLATDKNKVIMLLPGTRSAGRITMFHEVEGEQRSVPMTLITSDHLWEVGE